MAMTNADLGLFPRALPTEGTLFPIGRGSSSFTTLSGLSGYRYLDNGVLNPQSVASGLEPVYTSSAPGNKRALSIKYAKGSYKPSASPRGGVSFYSHGPSNFDFTKAKEATMSYSIYFPPGFDWVKGGKLPGLFGGDNAGVSYGCSGGRKDTRCWSARLMWRGGGAGEVYAYLPPHDVPGFEGNKAICNAPGNSCDATYGASIGRGKFSFKTGQWTTIAERVRLNDPGKNNGMIELWVDGRSVIQVTNAILRGNSAGKVQGMFMQSFFGGSSKDWATPRDQTIFISDISAAVNIQLNARELEEEELYARNTTIIEELQAAEGDGDLELDARAVLPETGSAPRMAGKVSWMHGFTTAMLIMSLLITF